MSIIFDYEESSVYVENPDPQAKETKIYYYKYKGDNKTEGHAVVSFMRRMYNLGKEHRSNEIRKALGV